MSSTTLESFETVDSDTCPHGVDTSESLLKCSYCWLEAESGEMAIDDPRREE